MADREAPAALSPLERAELKALEGEFGFRKNRVPLPQAWFQVTRPWISGSNGR